MTHLPREGQTVRKRPRHGPGDRRRVRIILEAGRASVWLGTLGTVASLALDRPLQGAGLALGITLAATGIAAIYPHAHRITEKNSNAEPERTAGGDCP